MPKRKIHFFPRETQSAPLLGQQEKNSPILPDKISPIPDHHSGGTWQMEYHLTKEGILYVRPLNPEDPKQMNQGDLESLDPTLENMRWKPFDDLGVPYNHKRKPFLLKGDKISEIAVASEIIMAVAEKDGRVYMYKPTEKTRPLHWLDKLGAPYKSELYLPKERRSWCTSCSVRENKEIRRTDFIHNNEVVDYFTDSKGERFAYGFTATTYVLDFYGLKITLWDTGLPPSFSRGFIVPDGTQGQEISAAGSIVFLSALDSNNKLSFWHIKNCYERSNACPGLSISYKKLESQDTEKVYALGEGVRQAPGEEWIEHDVSDISPYVTSKICIRLTGQGDEERELRIQGKDPILGEGYFYKKITESQWNFRQAPEVGLVDLDNTFTYPFNPDFPETLTMSYAEVVQQNTAHSPEITLGIENFHPFQIEAKPFYLRVDCGNLTEYLPIYSVDAWGLSHALYDDQLVGTFHGRLKALVGTLVLTPYQLELTQNENSPFSKYLREVFLPLHEETKSIPIVADNERVILKFGDQEFHFKRELSQKEKDYSFYTKRVMDPALEITFASEDECNELLERNRNCLKTIDSIFTNCHLRDHLFELANFNLINLHPMVKGFFKILNPKDPTYQQAVRDLEILFKVHKMALKYTIKNNSGYIEAREILKSRIKDLKEIMKTAKERMVLSPG